MDKIIEAARKLDTTSGWMTATAVRDQVKGGGSPWHIRGCHPDPTLLLACNSSYCSSLSSLALYRGSTTFSRSQPVEYCSAHVVLFYCLVQSMQHSPEHSSLAGCPVVAPGCKDLNDILGGGIETKAITEIHGEYRSVPRLRSHWDPWSPQNLPALLPSTTQYHTSKIQGSVTWFYAAPFYFPDAGRESLKSQ